MHAVADTQYRDADFEDRLREARIRHRVDLNNGIITIRLTSADDLEAARRVVNEADAELLVADGTDGKSLTIRMTEQQIKDRQDFAIEQNMTTLRNRVDQLGVAEPLVQRQGVDRIVVQLPGVQDPTELENLLVTSETGARRPLVPRKWTGVIAREVGDDEPTIDDVNLVDLGNLVGQSQATLLTTVVQMDPLWVYFDLPEAMVLQMLADLREMGIEFTEEGSRPDTPSPCDR